MINDLEPKIQSARKENLEERTKIGIEILDSLIPVSQSDETLSKGESLEETVIETRSSDLLVLSLEEIDLFKNAGLDQLLAFYGTQTSIQLAIDYLDNLMNQKFGNVATNIAQCIQSFPNLMASIPVVKKYVDTLVKNNVLISAKKLAEYAIEKRPSTKVATFYESIKPLQKAFHDKNKLPEEIAIIAKSRKLLTDDENQIATSDLTEAYLAIINAEKSTPRKDKLLKEAESEGLVDERLKTLRAEINSLLKRRKKIITWAAAAASIIVIGVVTYFVLSTGNKPAVTTIDEPAISTTIGIINTRVANIRSGPSISNKIVSKASRGDTLVILSETGNWLHVKHKGIEGYISSKLVNQELTNK